MQRACRGRRDLLWIIGCNVHKCILTCKLQPPGHRGEVDIGMQVGATGGFFPNNLNWTHAGTDRAMRWCSTAHDGWPRRSRCSTAGGRGQGWHATARHGRAGVGEQRGAGQRQRPRMCSGWSTVQRGRQDALECSPTDEASAGLPRAVENANVDSSTHGWDDCGSFNCGRSPEEMCRLGAPSGATEGAWDPTGLTSQHTAGLRRVGQCWHAAAGDERERTRVRETGTRETDKMWGGNGDERSWRFSVAPR
jgi:hypothetical protein